MLLVIDIPVIALPGIPPYRDIDEQQVIGVIGIGSKRRYYTRDHLHGEIEVF